MDRFKRQFARNTNGSLASEPKWKKPQPLKSVALDRCEGCGERVHKPDGSGFCYNCQNPLRVIQNRSADVKRDIIEGRRVDEKILYGWAYGGD